MAARGYREGASRMVLGRAVSFLPEEEPAGWAGHDLQFHQRMVQLGLVAARLGQPGRRLRILDFGGGFGGHALALRRLAPHLDYDYTVCELPSFCAVGRKLNPEAHFVSSLAEAGKDYDLVYASSSVQYARDWRRLVTELQAAGRGCIYITRTPFVFKEPTFVTVQRAYGTEYPGWVFNFNEFVGTFQSLGLCLREVFVNGRGISVRGSSEETVHLGLLLEESRNGKGR